MGNTKTGSFHFEGRAGLVRVYRWAGAGGVGVAGGHRLGSVMSVIVSRRSITGKICRACAHCT